MGKFRRPRRSWNRRATAETRSSLLEPQSLFLLFGIPSTRTPTKLFNHSPSTSLPPFSSSSVSSSSSLSHSSSWKDSSSLTGLVPSLHCEVVHFLLTLSPFSDSKVRLNSSCLRVGKRAPFHPPRCTAHRSRHHHPLDLQEGVPGGLDVPGDLGWAETSSSVVGGWLGGEEGSGDGRRRGRVSGGFAF